MLPCPPIRTGHDSSKSSSFKPCRSREPPSGTAFPPRRNRASGPRRTSADLGPRTAVDQALHRLVASRDLRRIACGFYDIPQDNRLTGPPLPQPARRD